MSIYNHLLIVYIIVYLYVSLFYADIDECASNPCQNGCLCTDEVNGYTCSTLAGYTGVHCETGMSFVWVHYEPHIEYNMFVHCQTGLNIAQVHYEKKIRYCEHHMGTL